MKGRSNWIGNRAEMVKKPVSLVEIAGERRVLIEFHKGISSYSPQKVDVCVGYGKVSVSGSNLLIARMTREQLVIFGCIESVTLLKAGGNRDR